MKHQHFQLKLIPCKVCADAFLCTPISAKKHDLDTIAR